MTRYASRLGRRSRGRPAGRQLIRAAVELAAQLAAIALIVIVLLVTGRYGRARLADLGAAIARSARAPVLTIAGLAVGVAEAGLAALAASIVLAGTRAWLPGTARTGAGTASAWLSLPRSGWARRWPRPGDGGTVAMACLILLAGVAAEETLFRGLLITAMNPLGGPAAIAVGGAAYLAYGLTRPAARGSRAEAVSCCLVLGVVNGTLFWLVPALLPLVAAQLAFVMFIG